MTILILNWRDIKNPTGGGAEILTHEMAKRWVRQKHAVIQISSLFEDAKQREIIDGVEFIRMGKWWSVHLLAFFYYRSVFKNKVDIIIDEVHWFPFFSYLYAPKKTVLFACEVANNLFFNIFPSPVALFWRFIEKIYLTVYKSVPVMVISPSTRKDLIKEGHSIKNIVVLPMGITVPKKITVFPKEKNPTLIYVARINKQKGIFDAILAFATIKKSYPSAKFWIIGSGKDTTLEQVKRLIKENNLGKSVKLYGFVSEEKKFELVSRAHLLISASVQEGWGLTVPEAGLVKTPSVVYDTQGFRDIIENKKDGILTDPNPEALAKGVIDVLKNAELYERLQLSAMKKSKQFSWDKTAIISLKFLQSL
jgi:glycosyltransferase involved in cell wall biosynthesis